MTERKTGKKTAPMLERYRKTIRPELKREFKRDNPHVAPRLEQVVDELRRGSLRAAAMRNDLL